MKKISHFLLALCLFLATAPATAQAAGSCTVSQTQDSPMIYTLTWSCTGDADTGALPSQISPYINGWVFEVITKPGSPAPTNGYGLTISDEDGVDIAAGKLAARSNSAGEYVKISGRYVNGTLTLAGSGNSVAAAVITVKVKYYREN